MMRWVVLLLLLLITLQSSVLGWEHEKQMTAVNKRGGSRGGGGRGAGSGGGSHSRINPVIIGGSGGGARGSSHKSAASAIKNPLGLCLPTLLVLALGFFLIKY